MFTKYDQFLRNVQIDMEDDVSEEAKEKAAKEIFEEHFLDPLGEGVRWVRLRGEFRVKFLDKLLIFLGSYEQARGTL